MAVRKLKSGRWCVEMAVGGTRVFRRLPDWATKADAQSLEAKLRRELWERHNLGARDEPSLAATINLWLKATEANKKDKLNPRLNARHLAPFVEGKTIRQVGEAAREMMTALGGAPIAGLPGKDSITSRARLSPATLNRRMDVLRASVRWAWKQGLVTDNLAGRVPRLREENARQVYLTAGQIRKLASCAPNSLCTSAIMLAAYTGLRASELLALKSSHLQKGTLTVAQSKTGKPRSIPVVSLLRPYLSALPLGCSQRLLTSWFHQARREAGMEHVHFHDLRHSCASMLINAGVDLYTVGKILGHSSPATTARYAHLSDASVRKAMGKLR